MLRQNVYSVALAPGATTSVDIAAPLARAVSTTGLAGLQVFASAEHRAHQFALVPGVGVSGDRGPIPAPPVRPNKVLIPLRRFLTAS